MDESQVGKVAAALAKALHQFGANSDANPYYREDLFPRKACIDLACFPGPTVLSDMSWTAYGLLAVLDWRPLPPALGLESRT
jgi:hypothetical protein